MEEILFRLAHIPSRLRRPSSTWRNSKWEVVGSKREWKRLIKKRCKLLKWAFSKPRFNGIGLWAQTKCLTLRIISRMKIAHGLKRRRILFSRPQMNTLPLTSSRAKQSEEPWAVPPAIQLLIAPTKPILKRSTDLKIEAKWTLTEVHNRIWGPKMWIRSCGKHMLGKAAKVQRWNPRCRLWFIKAYPSSLEVIGTPWHQRAKLDPYREITWLHLLLSIKPSPDLFNPKRGFSANRNFWRNNNRDIKT